MTIPQLLAAARARLLGAPWNPLARGAWCRAQRRHLRVPGHAVVWVRGSAVPWAEWGARRGYFEMQRLGRMSYLCALGAAVE